MAPKKGLGKGLDSLIPHNNTIKKVEKKTVEVIKEKAGETTLKL